MISGDVGSLCALTGDRDHDCHRDCGPSWPWCALSHWDARLEDARHTQASWTTSVSSVRVSSPSRLARTSTDKWPSKCAEVKNGDSSSCTKACLSASGSSPRAGPRDQSSAPGLQARVGLDQLPPAVQLDQRPVGAGVL